MKKLIVIAILVVAAVSLAFGATTYVTMLNAATATGAGTVYSSAGETGLFTCNGVWGVYQPTNMVYTIEGSIDGTVWGTLATITQTSTENTFHVADKPVPLIRANYVSRTGGSTITTLTVKCWAREPKAY